MITGVALVYYTSSKEVRCGDHVRTARSAWVVGGSRRYLESEGTLHRKEVQGS